MLLAAFLAVSGVTGCAADPDGRALLMANRAAMAAVAEGTRVTRYKYQAEGLEGSAVITFDLANGYYVDERTLGITQGADGFDGVTPWMRDLSGFHRSQRGGDRPQLAISRAYLAANAWWRPDRGEARIVALTCDSLSVTPVNGKPFEAWFDPISRFLTRVRQSQSWHTTVDLIYSNYDASGTARRIDIVTNDDHANPEVLTLESTTLSEARGATQFRMPANTLDDSKLPAGGRAVLPFRLINNHVIVNARVNGKGPFPFLVDTGGHNILTPVTATALNIRSEGSAAGGGSGEATTVNGYARVAQIDAGGAVLNDSTVLTLDFSPPSVEGLTLGGMLGCEFLERFVVEFDYGRREMTLIEPTRFDASLRRAAGVPLPMNFYTHMPQVSGTFEGIDARFNIDTGARSDVSLTTPFVERARLRDRYPPGITITEGWGAGGPARAYVVRARQMTFGPVEMTGLIAALSVAKGGVMADDGFEGNVGSGLLKRFVVTFDYANETIYFRRLQKPDADTSRFDRTGMWLNLAWGGMQVMDVAVEGPAAQAGIRAGDLITDIGDVKVTRQTLSEVRRLLKLLPVDRPVTVRFQRDGAAMSTSLTPRNLIPD
jgi:predicted aspartyl protease